MCFGCSKVPSHRDDSFEYPQHMFWLRNKKNDFLLRTLAWGPDIGVRNWQLCISFCFLLFNRFLTYYLFVIIYILYNVMLILDL